MQAEPLLPSRKPWHFIDRLIEVERYQWIITGKNISGSDYFIEGHFPANSIYPGMLLMEGIKQSAELLLRCESCDAESTQELRFVHSNARFLRMVVPGDSVRFTVAITGISDEQCDLAGVGTVDDAVVLRTSFAVSGRLCACVMNTHLS